MRRNSAACALLLVITHRGLPTETMTSNCQPDCENKINEAESGDRIVGGPRGKYGGDQLFTPFSCIRLGTLWLNIKAGNLVFYFTFYP